ncbi:MAG: hypothetical protein LBC99_01010 [Spirochaetota bacterium]|nr:hypothetical protein [Spirochaetota bacterium]
MEFDEFANALKILDRKGIDYIISYDGSCGGREYGVELPETLRCAKFLLNAGLSTQATLLGKRDTTYESLYVSNTLVQARDALPKRMLPTEQNIQRHRVRTRCDTLTCFLLAAL